MSNILYEDKMYNEEIKNMFLSKYQESTHRIFKRLFNRSYFIEEKLSIDLYNFNLQQIEEVLYNVNPSTLNSCISVISMLNTYIDWGIIEGLRDSNINPLRNIDPSVYRDYIDDTLKTYITDKELRLIEDFCNNAQDAVIFRLLFEGVCGKNLIELRNIKNNDINYNKNQIKLNDGNNSRIIQVSDRCMDLVKEAQEEDKYIKANGEFDTDKEWLKIIPLNTTDYLLRSCKTNLKHENDTIKYASLYHRIKTITQLLGHNDINPKKIWHSGIYHLYEKYITEGKPIDNDFYDMLSYKYNTSVDNIRRMITFFKKLE